MWKNGSLCQPVFDKKAINEIEDKQLRSKLEKIILYPSEEEDSFDNDELEIIYDSSSDSSYNSNDKDCQCNSINY